MTAAYFNLVFTRAVDGDHAALQRWYSDHVSILWRCETLRRATLYRRDAGVAHEADYICFYAFPDEAGFLHYEQGEAREAARVVIVNGWGREGVAITERRPFRRVWSRQAGAAGAAAHHTIWCLRLGAGPWDEVSRWLADRVHRLLQMPGVGSATVLRAAEAGAADGGDVLVCVGSAQPLGESLDWLHAPLLPLWGHAPEVQPRWRWAGQVVADWTR